MTTDHPASRNYPFRSMTEVRQANATHQSWFSPATLRWHGSRISGTLYAGRYFVSSEHTGFDRAGRAYTVREVQPCGCVATAEGMQFLQFASWSGADKAAQRLARKARQTV